MATVIAICGLITASADDDKTARFLAFDWPQYSEGEYDRAQREADHKADPLAAV